MRNVIDGDDAGIGLRATLGSCSRDDVNPGIKLLRLLEFKGVDGMKWLCVLDASRLSLCIDMEIPDPMIGGLQLGMWTLASLVFPEYSVRLFPSMSTGSRTRIAFKPGMNSASLAGIVHGAQQMYKGFTVFLFSCYENL